MLNEIKTEIPATLDAVVRWCDTEHTTFYRCVQSLEKALIDSDDLTTKMFKAVNKKIRRTRFGLAIAVIAGVAYVIKNERDKNHMKTKIIETDRRTSTPVTDELGSEAGVLNNFEV